MKTFIKYILWLFVISSILFLIILVMHIFSPIQIIEENIEIIKSTIIPLVCAYIPVVSTYYYNIKTDKDDLKRSLDILERHRQNNCIDENGNKVKDGTVMPGFAKEYGFIVSNRNKSKSKILKLAQKQDFLQRKVEGPENWVKNHFLGKNFK